MNEQSHETLDWARIRHLLKLGIVAALMVLIGDMLLGWGVHDASKGGMEGFLSAYLALPDSRIFWFVHHIAHIGAFAKGLTPYPKWCWICCPAVGMALTMLLKVLPETALRNAITAGWISIGNLWMFIGLLILSRKAEANARKGTDPV